MFKWAAVVFFAYIRLEVDRSLAERPKVGELQMDWLRSEDLKEVKVVTAPSFIIALNRHSIDSD
jgi:hypothetical protein